MNALLKSSLLIGFSLGITAGLPVKAEPQKSPSKAGKTLKTAPGKVQDPIDPANMDLSVKPQDDFFLYSNGGWVKRTEIPAEHSRWGSFSELGEKNIEALHGIARKASKTKADPAKSPELQRVGDYYASGMDEKSVESLGIKPLADEFKRIDDMKDRNDLLKEVAHLHSTGVPVFFSFGSGQDDKDSTRQIAQAAQGGLGLPDRDYYTKEDEASKKLRAHYVRHVARMLTLVGEPAPGAAKQARKILEFETALAKASRTLVELRDPQKNYNKMRQAELQALTPDWTWSQYFHALNLAEPGDINVHQPDFFKAANTLFVNTSIDDWKSYLRWHLIDARAGELSRNFVDQHFNFNEGILRGIKQMKPRWKRVVLSTDGAIGDALGKAYVGEHFPPEAKTRALEMIGNLKSALADRIRALDWMDDSTKQEALKKLAALDVKIGYPDKWRDYSMLEIDRGPFVLNASRADAFEVRRDLNKIGQPVDRSEWRMTPPTVNAYYSANMNEIVFPAGILQPPFFFANGDDAINYGAIGAVIGHEMTHGFDDQGRKFDAAGNLRDWWSPESAEKFKERSRAIVAQFNEYEPLPGLHVNGELTQGENIADLGGLKIAYAAFKKATAEKPPEKIDGFTPDQRFFLAFSQTWRSKQREQDLKLRLNTDPHSPARYRVNGPLSNLPEFQRAFNIADNSPMVRPADKRVNIW